MFIREYGQIWRAPVFVCYAKLWIYGEKWLVHFNEIKMIKSINTCMYSYVCKEAKCISGLE